MGIGRGSGRWAAAVMGALALAGPWEGAEAQAASYLDFAGLTRELRSVTGGSPLATLRSLGTSHQGREIWMVEIADRSGPPVDQRPGIVVVGNLSGDHVVGSHLALGAVRHLLGEGAAHADLRSHVVYVVPRLNPDGAERMFGAVRDGNPRNALPYDDDNDGRVDEDGPEDLNGDGMITLMRVPDPAGAFMIHPDEPRLMKRADASRGETGTHTLYWEGRDNDGDGFINEDGPGGVDLDRSFQHAYPYWERDAGPYMVSEPEARALMDFMVAHRNVAAILTFGHGDNLVTAPNARGELAAAATLDLHAFAHASNAGVFDMGVVRAQQGFGFGGGGGFGPGGGGGGVRLRGAQPGADNDPNSGRRPVTTVSGADREYFNRVSEAYREITGITALGLTSEAKGAFFQWGYFQFGVPSFSTPGWGLPKAASAEEGAERPARGAGGGAGPAAGGAGAQAGGGADARLLSAFEAAGHDVFVPWTPFRHPDLGDVEIGGFRPYALVNPPVEQVTALAESHGRFVARLASMLPRVRIADTKVTPHGGGVFTVTATVGNQGYLPSALQHGVVAGAVHPVSVQIQVPPEDILTGAAKTSTVPRLLGSGGRETYTWVVRGRPGASVEIRVRAQKGGSDTATVTLR